MNRIRFIFGMHNHQPVGNFDFVFERAYEQAYRPLIEGLARHPHIKWNLHCSGILWEWLQQHHPGYVEEVKRQVTEGRLELLGGGFYEPILCAIPPEDQISQIRRLNQFLRRVFGVRPRGMWLAERVWEPSLPVPIAHAGLEFTLVDDSHFLAAGLSEDALLGHFITDDRGVAIRLFPISQRLRYAIPFQDPEVTVKRLRELASPEGDRAVVMIDDGEKFGLWPETHRHVYEDGWLERFLHLLEQESSWLETSTCSDYLDQALPRDRVYLPTIAYAEMSEWTLPTAAQRVFHEMTAQLPSLPQGASLRPFLRGGIWRNFLTKYPEGNNLHKKMWRVSRQVHAALRTGRRRPAVPRARLRRSLAALHAGQCNDAYWHGVFGGLYLPHLRRAAYQQLLAAESLLPQPGVVVQSTDFDLDGRPEILLEGREHNLYLSPHRGGAVFEWDLKPFLVNLGDVLARRQEVYHRNLEALPSQGNASEQGVKTIHDRVRPVDQRLTSLRVIDAARRLSLLDRFLAPDTTRHALWQGRAQERGDFVDGNYAWAMTHGKRPMVRLKRQGTVQGRGPEGAFLVEIEKTVHLLDRVGWSAVYRLRNLGGHPAPLWFAVECNWGFATAAPTEHSEHPAVPRWERPDPVLGLILQVDCLPAARVWTFPVETVSTSEQGFEGIYQGTAVLFHWHVTLPPRESQGMSLTVSVDRLVS